VEGSGIRATGRTAAPAIPVPKLSLVVLLIIQTVPNGPAALAENILSLVIRSNN
jgi:hypothetical protein